MLWRVQRVEALASNRLGWLLSPSSEGVILPSLIVDPKLAAVTDRISEGRVGKVALMMSPDLGVGKADPSFYHHD